MVARVLVVDDHRIFAEMLAHALDQAGHEPVLADPGELDDDALVALAEPDGVVVLDLLLGPGRSGVALVPRFVEAGARVVVLTAADDRGLHAEAVRGGAAAVVEKLARLEQVLEIVGAVIDGAVLVDDRYRVELEEAAGAGDGGLAGLQDLTRREREVLDGLVAGRSGKDIAAELGVALPTVRTQIRSIYRKLGVNNQRAAILLALRAGWSARR